MAQFLSMSVQATARAADSGGFGRRDEPFTEEPVRRISGDTPRHADRVEFAFVDDAAHCVSDDAPEAVARLALEWFERVG